MWCERNALFSPSHLMCVSEKNTENLKTKKERKPPKALKPPLEYSENTPPRPNTFKTLLIHINNPF